MIRRSLLLTVAIALSACQSPGVAATATPRSTPRASPAPSAPATADPAPSAELAPFACEFPVDVPATAGAIANIVDVRVGTHDGYDRVVFEFTTGAPEITLDRAEPPFLQDGSGLPIDVEGQPVLRLVMRGGTKQTESGGSSYEGPTDFDPGFAQLVDLVEGGDFEAQSTWYLGLAGDACVRVFWLAGPDRLVIDVEH
jgi:hypothetical protein